MTVSLERRENIDYSGWKPASWKDYEQWRDSSKDCRGQLFFFHSYLLVENMSGEGFPHAQASDLIRGIIFYWLGQHPETKAEMVSQCSLEKQGKLAAVPDIALYLGEGIPSYQPGDLRAIDLDQNRPPDLVVEIADTTLASD
ncbi:MAG: Uma2 family endonuclease, partial [Thermostichales cyanobacterium HHBFW_bins_127]